MRAEISKKSPNVPAGEIQTLDFGEMTPTEVVTLLRVGWGDSDTDYRPPEDTPVTGGLLSEVVLVHLDDIAATDHDRAKATLDVFVSSPLPADRGNAFALLTSFSLHDRDAAMPYWERLICDANVVEVSGRYEDYLSRHLEDYKGREDSVIEDVGLVPADVRYLLQLGEQARAEGTLVDLGQLAVEKLLATQPNARASAHS